MKVVHINKKNLEVEAANQRMINDIAAKRAKLEMKRFLKSLAKEQTQKSR